MITLQTEYKNIIDKSKIIDIRNSISYLDKNIKGSVNVPRLMLMSSPDLYINKCDTYYLICDKGTVSLSCAKILNALGYKCYSVIGGIEGIKN